MNHSLFFATANPEFSKISVQMSKSLLVRSVVNRDFSKSLFAQCGFVVQVVLGIKRRKGWRIFCNLGKEFLS